MEFINQDSITLLDILYLGIELSFASIENKLGFLNLK